MKQLKIISMALLCLFCIVFYSCKKSDTPKPVTNNTGIAGYWFGTANGGEFNQSFLLRTDGTLKVYDFYYAPTSTDTTKAYDGTGTYTVSGDLIVINTSFPNGETFKGTGIISKTSAPETFTMGISSGYNGDVYTKK